MSDGRNGEEKDIERSHGAVGAADEAPAAESPGASGLEASSGGAAADEPEALRREVAELKDALLRRRADFENYRRRVERERATATLDAEAELLRQLLGTIDNLERALQAAGGDASPLREGVALTHHELMSALAALGVEVIEPAGQPFDPALHQAIVHEAAEGFEPGTVAEVYRKGYRYRGRLLRPALVKVASGAVAAPAGETQVQ